LKYKKLKIQICQLWSIVNFFLNNRLFLKLPGKKCPGTKWDGEEMSGEEMAGEEMSGEEMSREEMSGKEMTGEEMTGEEMGRGRNGSGKKWVGEEMGPGRNVGEEMSGEKMAREELAIYHAYGCLTMLILSVHPDSFLKYVLSLFKLEKHLSAEATLAGSVRLIASNVKIVG
jgi:hypothetical protein